MSVTIFNHGGGGVSDLAIKVVGGIVQPNGAAGLLWVNTNTQCNHWSFAVAQPANPKAGDIWVQTDATSANVINLLKTNAIKVNILRVKQYNGAAWVAVAAYYYATSWTQISNTFNPATDITYTGSKTLIDEGNGHWKIKFLTSGTLRFLVDPGFIDLFAAGGGGGGGSAAAGGGGGGYTVTQLSQAVVVNQDYAIVIGAGGAAGTVNNNGGAGGTTTGFSKSAPGGAGGIGWNGAGQHPGPGGAGGSGGGGGYDNTGNNGGAGGANGGNGVAGQAAGGTGQGTTTKEFAEATGALYAGGGGGANYGAGGDGGGGRGGVNMGAGAAGTTNSGGGGGGGGTGGANAGGAGGSGIFIIRDHRAA